jgi:hypothetical protein
MSRKQAQSALPLPRFYDPAHAARWSYRPDDAAS